MIEELRRFAGDCPGFHAAFGAALSEGQDVLCVGPFSVIASQLALSRGARAHLMCPESALEEASRVLPSWNAPVNHRAVEGSWDLIFAPMYINHIPKRELVDFLFDVRDSLRRGGRLILSFEDSLKPDLGEGRSAPLWFCGEEVLTKYYTVEDMVNTLCAVGFSVTGIEEMEGPGIIHAVSLSCCLHNL